MMQCLTCKKQFNDEDRVFVLCDASVYRETNITHALHIWDDVAMWHLDCYRMPWYQKLWLKIVNS